MFTRIIKSRYVIYCININTNDVCLISPKHGEFINDCCCFFNYNLWKFWFVQLWTYTKLPIRVLLVILFTSRERTVTDETDWIVSIVSSFCVYRRNSSACLIFKFKNNFLHNAQWKKIHSKPKTAAEFFLGRSNRFNIQFYYKMYSNQSLVFNEFASFNFSDHFFIFKT